MAPSSLIEAGASTYSIRTRDRPGDDELLDLLGALEDVVDSRLIQSNEPRTWTSVEELKVFVHGPEHSAYLARRREWFERMDEAIVAQWWVEAGYLPPDEAKDRLALLDRVGPSPAAFAFRTALPAPEAAAGEGQTVV